MRKTFMKLEASTLKQAVALSGSIGISTTEYINQAVAHYNRMVGRKILAKQLAEESLLCREESLGVLAEFENGWKV